MTKLLISSMVVLLAVWAVLWGIRLQTLVGVGATGHSATRSFASQWVLPEGEVHVTIVTQDYGAFAQVVETLPEGFSFTGSSLPDVAVEVEISTLIFTLLGEEEFTYTVQASDVEGTYTFSGILRDQNKSEEQIGGDSSLRVGPEPTPTPTPTPTSPPTATATPEPTPTTTPDPTPTATPTPAPTPESTSTPAPQPTPESTPRPTPASTPSPTAVTTPTAPTPTSAPESTPSTVTTPTPTSAPTPSATAEATPAATVNPESEATLTPAPTPTPETAATIEPGEPGTSTKTGIPAWLIALLIGGLFLVIVGVAAYAYRRPRQP